MLAQNHPQQQPLLLMWPHPPAVDQLTPAVGQLTLAAHKRRGLLQPFQTSPQTTGMFVHVHAMRLYFGYVVLRCPRVCSLSFSRPVVLNIVHGLMFGSPKKVLRKVYHWILAE